MTKSLLKIQGKGSDFPIPILFVHGAWHGAWCWKRFREYLSELGVTSYAIDLPGHGNNISKDVVGLGIMDYVEYLRDILTQLAPEKPILVGHSMGGLILQKYLEKQTAPGAVLMAPCPSMGGSLYLVCKFLVHQFVAGINIMWKKSSINKVSSCRRLFLTKKEDNETVRKYWRRLVPESSRAIRNMVIPGCKVKAGHVLAPTPVLVIAAGKDYFFPCKKLKRWGDKFKYDVIIYPEAAHNLMMEENFKQIGDQMIHWLHVKIK